MNAEMILLAGNANLDLADSIAKQLGMSLSRANVSRFSDGEISVEIDSNVRGRDV